uniref:SKP1 component dimerisation domain-containing protein n=1 Tax=Globodera rostochiensis TaxID=31243 RepID=A0A914HB22_GLORO
MNELDSYSLMSESDSSKKNMGAEKENTLPVVNTSKQSNSTDSEEKRLQNEMQAKFESLQSSSKDTVENRPQNEVQCLCSDGVVMVPIALMPQCKVFNQMAQNCDSGTVFPIQETLSVGTFNKVVAWMKHRAGKDEPKVETDPNTHERKWFKLDDFETKFFEMDVKELTSVMNASGFLQIESLSLYACQSMAAVMKDKPLEELRQLFVINAEDELSEERLAKIRTKNAWCAY